MTPDQASKKAKKPHIKKTPDKTQRPRRPINKTPRPPPTDKQADKNVGAQPVGDVGVKSLKKIKRFFSQYSKFQYQPGNSFVIEFNRLCKEYHWKKDDKEKLAARRKFDFAMKQEFNNLYGSDDNDINNWYKLCHVLRIDPVPKTLRTCRAVRPSCVDCLILV